MKRPQHVLARDLEELTEVVKKLAVEHSADPMSSVCECDHVRGAHAGDRGACCGRRCKGGPCERFRGTRKHKHREYERVMQALLYELGITLK